MVQILGKGLTWSMKKCTKCVNWLMDHFNSGGAQVDFSIDYMIPTENSRTSEGSLLRTDWKWLWEA